MLQQASGLFQLSLRRVEKLEIRTDYQFASRQSGAMVEAGLLCYNRILTPMQSSLKDRSFTNATGKSIRQLFLALQYEVPGKVYQSNSHSHKGSHSLVLYIKDLLAYVLSAKFKQVLSSLHARPKRTLQSVFGQESLAILSYSFDLDYALTRAQEYNIPLLQVVILSAQGQDTVKHKLLLCFRVAHLINQNFVLYGDWEARPDLSKALLSEKIAEGQFIREQGIYMRMGELVYAFIPMSEIANAEEQILEQNLIKVRNSYYQIGEHSQTTYSNINPSNRSDFSPSASMFGPQRSQQEGENFNDSDQEVIPNIVQ